MAEIQKKIIKQSGRNATSRLLQAENDKEAIAAWKLDLNRILHVFNVCSAASVWLLLIVYSQTELAMNTHVIVSDVRHGVVDTHTMVSDIHRNMVTVKSHSTLWRGCFLTKAGSTTPTPILNAPNHTWLMSCTVWVARWGYRPNFGIDNVC